MSAEGEGQRIEVGIGANIQALLDGMRKASEGVKESTDKMNHHFESLHGAMEKLKGPFLAITGLLAGGKLFKEAIDETVKWTMETAKLSRTLGIIPQEASVLKVALHTLGIEQETYLQANRMMVRQINSGGAGFKALGIDIKDVNTGAMKPSTDLMMEAIEKIKGLKQGIDQQSAGMKIFGRGWGEAQSLLRLTKERMEEAREEAEKLHLVVGPEGIAKTREYQESMRKLTLIGESLQIQIGSALMPTLVKLGKFFGEIGPGLAMVMSASIKGLTTAFYTVKFAIETVVAYATDFFLKVVNGFKVLGKVAVAIFKGEWSSIPKIAEEGYNEHERITKETTAITKDLWEKLGDDLADIWDDTNKHKTAAPEGNTFDPDKDEKDKKESRVGAWELELKAQEEAQAAIAAKNGQFYEKDLAEELRFWQAKLALTEKGSKEQAAIQNKLLSIKIESYKADLEEKKAQLENEIAAERVNLGRKLELTKQELAMYAVGSKGYEAARRKVVQVEREISQELNALMRQRAMFQHDLDLKTIEGEEATLAFRKEMGQVAQDEEYAAEVAFEDRKLKIKRHAIAVELAQGDLTREKTRELLNQKYMLEVEHDQKLAALRNQMAVQERANMLAFFAPLTQAFQGAMEQLLAGTTTWSQAVKQIWKGLGQVIDQMIVKMVMSYVTGKQKEVMAEQWATIQKIAIQTWGAIKSVALAVWAGIKWVAVKGYEAAAGAYSAIASIPFVGPFLAPAVAAGVLAAVLGMGSKIASAAGGWERIPSDQIAQLHKNEMVLPAHLAERVRNMTGDGEGGGGRGGGGDTYQVTIQAMDGQDVHRVLTKHQDSLFRIFREGSRNGRI